MCLIRILNQPDIEPPSQDEASTYCVSGNAIGAGLHLEPHSKIRTFDMSYGCTSTQEIFARHEIWTHIAWYCNDKIRIHAGDRLFVPINEGIGHRHGGAPANPSGHPHGKDQP